MAKDDEADRAYQAALALIEEVRKAGQALVSFDAEEFRALTRIPPEIAGIEGLVTVDLDNTQVSDTAPLAALTGLTTLSLTGTQVSNIAPLASLTWLAELYLRNTKVSDIAPVAALKELTGLYLTGTQVNNIAPLSALDGLLTLDLSNTPISDIAPLAALKWLTKLDLSDTAVSDTAALGALTELEGLYLSRTQVSDIAPLVKLKGLEKLWLSNTPVMDTSIFATLKALNGLDLRNTQVIDLRPIATLSLDTEGLLNGLWFTGTPATEKDPELARLAAITNTHDRTAQTLAYLRTLPPWPEPLPWLQAEDRTGKTRHNAPLSPSPVPGKGLVPPAGLKRLSLADARRLLQSGHPVLRDRCQRVVAEIDDALAMLAVRIPNEPERLAEHNALTRTLTLAKAAMVDIHEAIPEALTDQPITDAEAGRLRAAFDAAIEKLKTAAAYVDRKDHTPTFGACLNWARRRAWPRCWLWCRG